MEGICPTHGRIEDAKPVYRGRKRKNGGAGVLEAAYCRCGLQVSLGSIDVLHSMPEEAEPTEAPDASEEE